MNIVILVFVSCFLFFYEGGLNISPAGLTQGDDSEAKMLQYIKEHTDFDKQARRGVNSPDDLRGEFSLREDADYVRKSYGCYLKYRKDGLDHHLATTYTSIHRYKTREAFKANVSDIINSDAGYFTKTARIWMAYFSKESFDTIRYFISSKSNNYSVQGCWSKNY